LGSYRCAFLTQSTVTDDDALAATPLLALGWQLDAVPWRRPDVDWSAYDLVVIRSAWDYHHAPDEFLDVLARIDDATTLENSLDHARWNVPKTYLRDLAAAGVPIVPTVWHDRLRPGTLDTLFGETGAGDIVIKPVVSASAHGSFRLHHSTLAALSSEIETFFSDTAFMAQPLVPTVLTEGEYSLFYLGGEYSHAVVKQPRQGDYRVQEEYGGSTQAVAVDRKLLEAGRTALEVLDTPPLYARVDLVRANDEPGYWLMEMELIEPVLYLATDPQAPVRFAEAIAGRRRPA
jgi:glutathione synthase/RimK-type ligase-like ATP-grasp enzyme